MIPNRIGSQTTNKTFFTAPGWTFAARCASTIFVCGFSYFAQRTARGACVMRVYINSIPGMRISTPLNKIFTNLYNSIEFYRALMSFDVALGQPPTSFLRYSIDFCLARATFWCLEWHGKFWAASRHAGEETRKNSFDVGSKNFSTLQIASGSN